MEFQVREFKTPEQILFNYEDLKQQLTEECHAYTKLVVTEDAIAPAKRDLADLRRLDKALNDERLRIQREYMKPFDSFKDRVDELRGIIKNAETNIDRQLKAFDEAQASKKKEEIQELFKSIGFQPFVRLDQIWNPKWRMLRRSAALRISRSKPVRTTRRRWISITPSQKARGWHRFRRPRRKPLPSRKPGKRH